MPAHTAESSRKAKDSAARRALRFVEPHMRLGLGTGSTAAIFVELLAEKVKAEAIPLLCVASSRAIEAQAREAGLRLATLDMAGSLDLTVDGADEIAPDLTLLKGGGGALLREKILAAASARFIVIADESKRVAQLGAFPLPAEVTPFASSVTGRAIARALEGQGLAAREGRLRMCDDAPFLTDGGNHILDFALRRIENPASLAACLSAIPGVVEHGLFVDLASLAIIGYGGGETETLARPP